MKRVSGKAADDEMQYEMGWDDSVVDVGLMWENVNMISDRLACAGSPP